MFPGRISYLGPTAIPSLYQVAVSGRAACNRPQSCDLGGLYEPSSGLMVT